MQTKEEKAAYCKSWQTANPDYRKAHYEANREKFLSMSKTYNKNHKEKIKVYKKAWDEANKEKTIKTRKVWTKINRKKICDYQKHWNKINPKKRKARSKMTNAIASGRLIRPKLCSLCYKETKLHGHHKDYSKPLNVEWLCVKCHYLIHRFIN